MHHFKNHLISQKSILSIFMESLFVQWRIKAKLNVMSFQCHCKLEWQHYIQFALIPADFCLDICLDHTFITNCCLSIYNNICNSWTFSSYHSQPNNCTLFLLILQNYSTNLNSVDRNTISTSFQFLNQSSNILWLLFDATNVSSSDNSWLYYYHYHFFCNHLTHIRYWFISHFPNKSTQTV